MKNRDLRISDNSRQKMIYFSPVFETDLRPDQLYRQAQEIALVYNSKHDETITAGGLNSSAVLHLVYQTVITEFLKTKESDPFSRIGALADRNPDCAAVLDYYDKMFPTELEKSTDTEELVRAFFVHQVLQANPALLTATSELLSQDGMNFPEGAKALRTLLGSYLKGERMAQTDEDDLFTFLTLPARLFPDSLPKQIAYILENWQMYLPDYLRKLLLNALDYIAEEQRNHGFGGPGEISLPDYSGEPDYESFTQDKHWMPNVVMMAKSTLVWLDQLSKKYGRNIDTLDKIPDEELDYLRDSGFSALWLIGLWERSPASKKIKTLCGNPDAESSAYSLKGYNISNRMGGWGSLNNLRERCRVRGIRLASDMVPNHTGLDSDLLFSHPEYFISQDYPPFPSYSYSGQNLSDNPDYDIRIEDHYFNRTDAAVTFYMRDNRSGQVRYVFHGNDGTTMPWNDTAQLDYLNPQTREAVIQQILEVARNFPIIRFDAAMTLAKRHIQRLWYPRPGSGGDVAGRASHSISDEEFNRRIPIEFWREVVDRIQSELPDTLLLAEAFWMMESYFVRTLGMHRVYNSAFMHMMKNEDNRKYRDSIKNILAFDPEILKRYVNFMNNPDEETAIAQFGNGDKYFGICTMLSTMPGLPLFGHGQIEGFHEKYGMEYQRAYWDEKPDQFLIDRHKRQIFPLLKMRYLYSNCNNFQMFDVRNGDYVEEAVYAFVNGDDRQMSFVLYNNRYEHSQGRIYDSVPKLNKATHNLETVSLARSLRLTMGGRHFLIYKNFNEGLYHICPSMRLYDEGFWVSLDGYQTMVLTEIREVEDVDGIYSELYRNIGDRGIADIGTEIRLMYLRPFFEVAQNFKDPAFIKALRKTLSGKGSAASRKEILHILANGYTYLEELNELFARLGLHVSDMKPARVLKLISRIEKVSKQQIFSDGGTILSDQFATIVSAALVLLPFTGDGCSLYDAMGKVRTLMLDRLYEQDLSFISRAALLVCKDPLEIEQLLNNDCFLDLIGRNEYQGICWYKGEAFQECMYTACFADAVNNGTDNKKSSETIKYWLRKNATAGYKVAGLK